MSAQYVESYRATRALGAADASAAWPRPRERGEGLPTYIALFERIERAWLAALHEQSS